MSLSVRNLVRLLAIVAILGTACLVLGTYLGTSEAACDRKPCHNCPHLVCNSACWADGTTTDPDSCTDVRHTPFAPIECPPGGGCFTIPCN